MTMPALIAATVLVFSGPFVHAKTSRPAPPQTTIQEPDAAEYEPPQRFCAKLCESDMTPCDPPYMKNADARCANPGTTIGF